jgi:hypothetical protein
MFNQLAPIFLLGSTVEILWLLSYRLSPLRSHSGLFVALMLTIFGLSLWSFFRCRIKDRMSVLCVLGFALLFRLTVLPAPPGQSEDVYRYLWDARLSSMGVDPYRYPPDAIELQQYRDQRVYPMVNSKPYITAYPPLSEAIFSSTYRLFGPSVVAMKAVFGLLEFSSLLLVWRLLVQFKASLQPLLLMAWNPFFVFEFSHSGHSDSGMMFLILLSIYLVHRARNGWAMASYAGSVLAKLHPALWFPVLARKMGWKANAVCCAVTTMGALFYFSRDTWIPYLRSLRLYYRLFEFNAGIHYLLRFLGNVLFRQAWDKVTGPYLVAILVLITILIGWRFPVRNARELLHAGFWIMTADLCLSTTVHPWYLSWAALALPVFPYAFMTYWTGASFLSYLAYAYHPIHEPTWVLLVEYLPMYVLMGMEVYRGAPLLCRTNTR